MWFTLKSPLTLKRTFNFQLIELLLNFLLQLLLYKAPSSEKKMCIVSTSIFTYAAQSHCQRYRFSSVTDFRMLQISSVTDSKFEGHGFLWLKPQFSLTEFNHINIKNNNDELLRHLLE